MLTLKLKQDSDKEQQRPAEEQPEHDAAKESPRPMLVFRMDPNWKPTSNLDNENCIHLPPVWEVDSEGRRQMYVPRGGCLRDPIDLIDLPGIKHYTLPPGWQPDPYELASSSSTEVGSQVELPTQQNNLEAIAAPSSPPESENATTNVCDITQSRSPGPGRATN